MASEPLRVGIFATPVGSNGGIARWITETTQLLAHVGIRTELLIGRQASLHLNDPMLAAASVPVTRHSYRAQARRLRRWLAATEVDVLITALPQAALVAALARPPIPIVATIHGHRPPGARGTNTQVVTVADRLGPLWRLPRWTTIANALASPAPAMSEVKRLGSVAYVGRLEPEKGIDRLLELVVANPGLEFHIAGDGGLRSTVESMARSVTNVTFHRWVQDVPAFLAPIESVVFPAPAEGMPYALIESLWSNCLPIIRSTDLATELGLDPQTTLAERCDLSPVIEGLRCVDLATLRKPFSADEASASWATLLYDMVGGRR